MFSSQEIPQRVPAGSAGREAELALLISQIARGDQQAYGQFYDRTAGAVLGMVLGVIRDREQSEEVMQEVLLEAWRTASRFDLSRGTVMSWLMALAHRRVVDRMRSEARLLGVPAGTVKTRIRDRLIRIRDGLGAEE